jgi:cell filamentation protein
LTFDPFDDFEERGYLRNFAGEKDLEVIKIIEHRSFLAKLETAFQNLSQIGTLSYEDVLDTHKILFKSVYPWAGQDRSQTAPGIAVSRGSVLFAHPEDAKTAVEYALRIGQNKDMMANKPGEVMGYLAYGHPFLDGNGRTIMVVHTELAQRAGVSIDWAATSKSEYIIALTKELEKPGIGYLDAYLSPFKLSSIGLAGLAGHIARTPGLDGNSSPQLTVLGKVDDPALKARYEKQKRQRAEPNS